MVEAKSHIGELVSSCAAGDTSLARIRAAFDQTAAGLGVTPRVDWATGFYQFANRVTHLDFLMRQGEPAWLVCVCFVGDREMAGPECSAEWRGAMAAMRAALGLGGRHKLAARVIDVFVELDSLSSGRSG